MLRSLNCLLLFIGVGCFIVSLLQCVINTKPKHDKKKALFAAVNFAYSVVLSITQSWELTTLQ